MIAGWLTTPGFCDLYAVPSSALGLNQNGAYIR